MQRSASSTLFPLLTASLALACQDVPDEGALAGTSDALLAGEDFHTFETDQVRPLCLSPDGQRLFATNTPDNQLEIYDVTNQGLRHVTSVPVGLEPTAVAARSASEVWVVNHLSDSVSVVRLRNGNHWGVERTLLVGDEPRDVVFAGPGRSRAFITAAHRGQNVPFNPQLTTEGVGRADVWVFDANNLGVTLQGSPIAIVNLFTDKPRALTVSPDGSRVYAAGYFSGNQTTIVAQGMVVPALYPPPFTNHELSPAPVSSLIVRWNGENWVDENGTPHDYGVRIDLPDRDVFVIDANAGSPALLSGEDGFYASVGTVLFNMAVNPVSGRVYVSNTEALNEQRFTGPGVFAGHTLRGHFSESRITVLDPSGTVTPRHLNPHIDYGSCCDSVPNDENARSLAFPQSMAVSADGSTLYVSALGSDEVGIFSTAELEAGTFVPSTESHIALTGGGPTGLVLDEARRRLYVLTRFDNGISIVDTTARAETGHVRMFNPEPPSVVEGRRFLYDARHTSSHGDSACASCHIFGDFDGLAWDLGNPDGDVVGDPNEFANQTTVPRTFHPMKGPMVTQSLRGMDNMGPMHWRGDRTGGYAAPNAQPGSGAFDEMAAFMEFNGAFPDLVGRAEPLPEEEMRAFGEFMLQVAYPPNPIRNLDNSLNASQRRGAQVFDEVTTLGVADSGTLTCEGCHRLDRNANLGLTRFPGFFGTDGRSADVLEPQNFKTPHLRNLYQRIGMFGSTNNPVFFVPGIGLHQGDQIRGFGFAHDGEAPTLFGFVTATLFVGVPVVNPHGFVAGPEGDQMRRDVEQYMLAFDSNLAPIVGQQTTLTATNALVAGPRIDLFEARAARGECDLIAKRGNRGWLYANGMYEPDRESSALVSSSSLRASALSLPITFTCVPPGEGVRRGIDRDRDGALDGDERARGTDPSSPESHP